jgi:hypothetical protein
VDATLLDPALKISFMKKVGYNENVIARYETEALQRFTTYDTTSQICRTLAHSKHHHPALSESSSSDNDEFNSFLGSKRDK